MDDSGMAVADRGLTHVAFLVSDLDQSIAFYSKYARMEVVHSRSESSGSRVAWISDRTRAFVLVLVEIPSRFPARKLIARMLGWILPNLCHIGVACGSRGEVDEMCSEAKREGVLQKAPVELPPPVGYFAFINDPDGYTLELSVGQEIEFNVREPRVSE
jgi:catechol 2,3-dioxygenase-like lactoylglutathione lyase family enzyme